MFRGAVVKAKDAGPQAEEFEACCTWFDPDLMQPSAVGYSLQAQQSSLVVQFLLADGPAGPAGHSGGRDPGQGKLRGGGSSRVCLWRQGCESASQVGEFAAAAGGQASQDHGACVECEPQQVESRLYCHSDFGRSKDGTMNIREFLTKLPGLYLAREMPILSPEGMFHFKKACGAASAIMWNEVVYLDDLDGFLNMILFFRESPRALAPPNPNGPRARRLRSPDFFDALLTGKSSKEYGVSVLNKFRDLLPNHGAEAIKRLQLFVRSVDEKAHPVPEP